MRKLIYCALIFLCMTQARAQNMMRMEYFIDTDPGLGLADTINGFAFQADIANFVFPVHLYLSQGIHTVGVRSRDANNKWSMTNFFLFYVLDSSHAVVKQLEYFWDTDPGFNNGIDTLLNIPDTNFVGILYAKVPLTLNVGQHHLFVRSKESRNQWSHTNFAGVVQVDTVTADTLNTAIRFLPMNSGISIFPNPCTTTLTVSPKENEKLRLVLYDASGRLMMDKMIEEKTSFDMSPYHSGAYTLFAWSEKDHIYKTILIKE